MTKSLIIILCLIFLQVEFLLQFHINRLNISAWKSQITFNQAVLDRYSR